MLDFMRKSANTIFIKAFLALLILSFAAFGIGDVFNGRANSTAIATVGKTEISVAAYRAEYARELERAAQLFGQEITPEQGKALGVGNRLIGRLIQDALITESTRDMGLLITDAQILDEIRKSPQFSNDAGQFDRNLFVSILRRNGFDEDTYVQRVRENILRTQFLGPILDGALAPKPLVDALYAYNAEQRTADVIRIDYAALKDIKAPSEDELVQYHKDNAANYMAPEYRRLTAIVLRAETLARDVTVSADEIQAAYDEREADYLTPEKRTLRQILTLDEDSAQKAKTLLDGGTPFAEVVAQVGANPAMIEIGSFTTADATNLSPDIATAVFAVEKGARTAPLQSPLGWHIFEVTDITPKTVKPLADVRDALTLAVKLDRALTLVFDLSNKVDDLLGGGMTFEEAARQVGISPTVISAVDARGFDPKNTALESPFITDILTEAFKLNEGQDSQMTETADGNAFFVVRIDGVTAPALRPLADVRTEVVQALDQKARAARATELAKTAQQRLKSGDPAADVAQAIGFRAITTPPFTRNGAGLAPNTLPGDALTELFALKQGEATAQNDTGALVVARVASIVPAQLDTASEQYRTVAEDTLSSMQSDLLAQLSSALEVTYGVSLNQKAINEAF